MSTTPDDAHSDYRGDFRDPSLLKYLLPLLLVVALAAGAVIKFGFAALVTIAVGATAGMFLIILGLTRGDV